MKQGVNVLVVPAIVTAIALGALEIRTSAQRPAVPTRPDISGFWELAPDGRHVPAASLAPAFTPAMREAAAKRDAKAVRWCNIIGIPAAMDTGRPIDIRQNAGEVVLAFEANAAPRHIYLNRGAHVPTEEFDPTTNGDSIGRWDGDTLVVDTVGFDPAKGLTAIPGGGFRQEKAHLVERYRLLDGGRVLSVTFTWDDPTVFVGPHTYEFRYFRLSKDYEARPAPPCDPFNDERTRFLEAQSS